MTDTGGRERFGESLYVEWQPTLATSPGPPADPDFSKTPNQNRDICLGYGQYMASVVKQMKKPKGVSDEDFDQARQFCTHVLSNYLASRKIVNYRRDMNLADELLQHPEWVEDPLVQYCAALVAWKTGRPDLTFGRIVKAVDTFPKYQYSSRVVVAAFHLHARSWTARVKNTNVPDVPIEALADALWYRMIHDLDAQPEEYRYVWNQMQSVLNWLKGWRRTVYEELYEKLTHDKRVPKWLSLMIQLSHLNALAWEHRGGGFANTVTEQGWKKFAEYQTRAESVGRQALEENPFAPEPISFLMDIALSGHSETTTREWFEKAVAIQFDFEPAYDQLIRELSPKWGGSLEEMLEFGRECRDTERYDTTIPLVLVKIFQSFTNDEPNHPINRDREVLVELAEAIEKCCEHAEGDGLYGDFNLYNTPAYVAWGVGFAYRAGDYQLAKRLLELTQEELDLEGLIASGCLDNPEVVKQRIAVETSSYAEAMVQIAELRKSIGMDRASNEKGLRQVMEICEQVIADTDSPEVRRYFEIRLEQCKAAFQYYEGEWVSLPFGPNLDNWDGPGRDLLKRIDERTVEFTKRTPADGFQLNARHHFPGPKIMEYELDWSNESAPPHVQIGSQAGLFGLYPKPYFLGVEPSTKRVYFGPQNWHFTPPGFLIPEVGRGKSVVFTIRIGPGYVDAFVNGEFAIRSADLPIQPVTRFQISQSYGAGTRGRIRIRNPRVRRWMAGPPPWHTRDVQKMRDYYVRASVFEPDNRVDWFYRGVFEHLSGDLDAAWETFQKVDAMEGAYVPVHFYLGDICDRRGDKRAALEHYYQCVVASRHRPGGLPEFNGIPVPQPHTAAAFRVVWIESTAMDDELKHVSGEDLRHVRNVTQFEWANEIIAAAQNAASGNVRRARMKVEDALKTVPDNHRPFVERVRQKIAAGEPYLEPTDQRPFYLDLEGFGFDHYLSGHMLLPRQILALYAQEKAAYIEQVQAAKKRQAEREREKDRSDPGEDEPTIEPDGFNDGGH